MSTHNIGFYEEISKIITELPSNIIKYAPYFFCCQIHTCVLIHGPRQSPLWHGNPPRRSTVDKYYKVRQYRPNLMVNNHV